MNLGLTHPAAGQPVSATLILELLREVRANRPLSGKNTRTHRTPNGTHIEAVGSSAGRAAPATNTPGRFAITLKVDEPPDPGNDGGSPEQTEEEDHQTYTATFENPYYDIGGKTYAMSDDETGVTLDGIEDGSIIVLKVSAKDTQSAELDTVGSTQELQQHQEDTDYYTIPLYKVQGGKVVCDFRTGPLCAMGEF